MSDNYLDAPFTYSAIERDLLTALDERDAMIAHYQRREARRAAQRKAWGPSIALLVCLGWWSVGCAALLSGYGLLFLAANGLGLGLLVVWAKTRKATA